MPGKMFILGENKKLVIDLPVDDQRYRIPEIAQSLNGCPSLNAKNA